MVERIKTKISLKQLETIGIFPGTISAWKTNNRAPRSDDLYLIADYLNVSMEWLLTGETKERFNPNPDLPPMENKLLSDFRLLSEEQKNMFSLMLSTVANQRSATP